MVKRYGNLWQNVITKENIRLSYEQAKVGKGKKHNVRKFNKNLDANLERIRQSLIDKTFTTAKYNTKTVFEPKRRTIYILPFDPDRIVQHAVMNILIPISSLSGIHSAEKINGQESQKAHKKGCGKTAQKQNNLRAISLHCRQL